jgi:glycosyltransferase involved in cell wall biosynthesis
MRVGQNPAKFVEEVAQPQAVTVAIVCYIPFLGGYYAQGLEVLKECLGSIWANTDLPYDLMVFDNASCPEVRAFLLEAHRQGRIQYLVLSEKNVGKAGGWNFIFAAAPGETVAYADYDIYFYPGWLSTQLAILEALPNVGMVTGMPVRNPEKFSTNTVRWAEGNPDARLERGLLLPWEDFWQHVQSLGVPEAEARKIYADGEDICLHFGGRKYYVGAGHFQFLARRSVLQEVLPIPSRRPMGEVRLLDIAINKRGYLRLALPEWTVRHMGNVLTSAAGDETTTGRYLPAGRNGLGRWKPLRRLLTWVHKRSFDLLYRD